MDDTPFSPTPPCLSRVMAEDTLVTVQDIRAARYCLPGVRPWFRRHGLNWQAFLDAGILAETLRATGDALVEPVIRMAEERAGLAQTPATSVQSEPRHGR
jgi:hypothetical protein